MSRFLRSVPLLALLVCFAVTAYGGEKAKSSPNPAPDFTLVGLDGKKYSLKDFKGKVLLLDFWATWCGPCRKEIPHLKDLHAQYKEKGLRIVGIALDQQGEKAVKPFVESNGIPFTSLLGSSEVVQAYGNIRAIPTTFLIDKKGNIQKVYRGYTEKAVFEEDIKKLL